MFGDKKYLFSKNTTNEKTIINISGSKMGGNKPYIIAGPCTISNKDDLINLAIKLKQLGIAALRGGAYKPRTSPYSFQGLEESGLEYLIEAKKITGLPIVAEITSTDLIERYVKDIDIIQVGSRNMYNYDLLKRLGQIKTPILLKRAMSATYEEWLLAAEYILSGGNKNVILCERGIRTFEPFTRNTLDLQAISIIKRYSHLPIIVDPSHASGKSFIVEDMALASIAAGSDGLMIEVEENPDKAVCDKEQTIDLETLKRIIYKINKIYSSINNGE